MLSSFSECTIHTVGDLRKQLEGVAADMPIYIHYEPNYEDLFVAAQELDGPILLIPLEKAKVLSKNQNLFFEKIAT